MGPVDGASRRRSISHRWVLCVAQARGARSRRRRRRRLFSPLPQRRVRWPFTCMPPTVRFRPLTHNTLRDGSKPQAQQPQPPSRMRRRC